MDGYIFTWICIGMLLKPYMKILKLYYMVLHFCRFLDGNCIFISVPYIYSHLFWICNLRNILFWIECNLRWNFPFHFTQFVTGDWCPSPPAPGFRSPDTMLRENVGTKHQTPAWQQSNFPILVLGWRLMCSLCSLLLLSQGGELVMVILYLQTDQHFLLYPPSLSSYRLCLYPLPWTLH